MIRRSFRIFLHGSAALVCAGTASAMTLEEAYDRALATDQSVRIAFLEVQKANLLPWSALTRLGTQVIGSARYQRQEHSLTTPAFNSAARSRTGTGDASLTVEQPLIDLTVFPAYRLGRISATAARLAHQFTVRETLFGVATAYYEVLKQQRLVDVNREALRLAGQQLDISQKRADVGEVKRSDVLRAQVTVETARRTLVESENLLEFDRNTLGNILNLEPNARFTVVEPPDFPSALPPFDSLLQRAYAHREDFRVKELAVDQDIERRNEIVGQYGPRVVAQWDGALAHTSGSSTSNTRDWQAAVAVQLPIFTGGQREIDLRTSAVQIRQTRLDVERTAKTIESDVKQAWLTVRSLKQTLKALHTQVVAAEQGYHDLEIQYSAGTATSVDVLTALNDLNSARKDLAVQTYDYQVALRSLEQVSGVFQEARVQRSKVR